MLVGVEITLIGDRGKLAVFRGQPGFSYAAYQLLMSAPVGDKVGDTDDLDSELPGCHFQLWQARHCAIIIHNLTDDACRVKSCQPGEVDNSFGMPGPDQNPAIPRPEWKHMSGASQIVGFGRRINDCLYCLSPVCCRNARACAVFRLD